MKLRKAAGVFETIIILSAILDFAWGLTCVRCKGDYCDTSLRDGTCEGAACFTLQLEEKGVIFRGCVSFTKADDLPHLPPDFVEESCLPSGSGIYCTCLSDKCNLESLPKELPKNPDSKRCVCEPEEFCRYKVCQSDDCWTTFARKGSDEPLTKGCSNDIVPLPEGDFCVGLPLLGGITIDRPILSIYGQGACYCGTPYCNHKKLSPEGTFDGEVEVFNTVLGITVNGLAKIWLSEDAEPPLVKIFELDSPGFGLRVKYSKFEPRPPPTPPVSVVKLPPHGEIPDNADKHKHGEKGPPAHAKGSGKSMDDVHSSVKSAVGELGEGEEKQIPLVQTMSPDAPKEEDEGAPPSNNVTVVAIFIVIMIIIAFAGLAWKFQLVQKIKDARYQSVSG